MRATKHSETSGESTHNTPLGKAYRAILLVLTAAFTSFLVYIWHSVDREARSELSSTNRQFVHMVRAEFGRQESMLRLLGSQLLAAGALEEPGRGRALIDEMIRLNPAMAGFGLARPDGQLVLVSGVPKGRALPNLLQQDASRDGFLAALKASRMVIGRTYYFGLLKRWLIPVRLGLHAGGRLVAVMTAGIDIDAPEAL